MGKQTKTTKAPLYILGKAYNPQSKTANNNVASWACITAALKGSKGKTLAQLQALKPAHPAALANHPRFVKYAVRRGWLAQASAA